MFVFITIFKKMVVEFVVTVSYMIIHSVSKIYSFASVGVITITKVT